MPKPVKVEKYWKNTAEQWFHDGNKRWSVSRLIELAKDLEPFDIPMAGLNIYSAYPTSINSTKQFVGHIKQILEADLSYPIILDEDGYIMDGRHRVIKALLEGKETIRAVRFDETPNCDFEKEEPK